MYIVYNFIIIHHSISTSFVLQCLLESNHNKRVGKLLQLSALFKYFLRRSDHLGVGLSESVAISAAFFELDLKSLLHCPQFCYAQLEHFSVPLVAELEEVVNQSGAKSLEPTIS